MVKFYHDPVQKANAFYSLKKTLLISRKIRFPFLTFEIIRGSLDSINRKNLI